MGLNAVQRPTAPGEACAQLTKQGWCIIRQLIPAETMKALATDLPRGTGPAQRDGKRESRMCGRWVGNRRVEARWPPSPSVRIR
jgi:hypothetical protein